VTSHDQVVVPDVAEPLLAFRVWRWDRGTPLALWSLNAAGPKRPTARARLRGLLAVPDGAWPTDGPLLAACDKRGKDGELLHRPPDKDCTCGVYAATDINVVAGYIRDAPVLGLVQGSGQVIPADFGWRAEHVRIAALFDIEPGFTIPRKDLHRVADAYHVPLIRPYASRPDDYRHHVRSGFASGLGDEVEAFLDGLNNDDGNGADP
jgi:hypothetical protein